MAVGPKEVWEGSRTPEDTEMVDAIEQALDLKLQAMRDSGDCQAYREVEFLYCELVPDMTGKALGKSERRSLERRYRKTGWGDRVKAGEKCIRFKMPAFRKRSRARGAK